jgi:hypothetical protein
MGAEENGATAMTAIYKVEWSSEYYRGSTWEMDPNGEQKIIDLIVQGQIEGKVERVTRYDFEEDLTEDIAVEIARRFGDGDFVRPDLWQFIEDNAGPEYVEGLRLADMTFAAE